MSFLKKTILTLQKKHRNYLGFLQDSFATISSQLLVPWLFHTLGKFVVHHHTFLHFAHSLTLVFDFGTTHIRVSRTHSLFALFLLTTKTLFDPSFLTDFPTFTGFIGFENVLHFDGENALSKLVEGRAKESAAFL